MGSTTESEDSQGHSIRFSQIVAQLQAQSATETSMVGLKKASGERLTPSLCARSRCHPVPSAVLGGDVCAGIHDVVLDVLSQWILSI